MIVMKFGGASLATPASFQEIASLIKERSLTEKEIVVVVSAMGSTTDQLLSLAKQVHPNPPAREQDMLVSVGERISMALLAMALSAIGLDAVSFTGSQSGIITCENHANAKIVDVRPQRVRKALDAGAIVIVAGFQGVSRQGEITTLGRGGSDTSAVALASALGAPRVEFYKDVPGIFNADPKKNLEAKLYTHLSYAEALALTLGGAKVLHPRSVALAKQNGIELAVLSFQDRAAPGTVIGGESLKCSSVSYEVATCSLN
jgi:aspartate kinase